MQFLNHEKRRCNIQLSDVSLSFLLDPDIVIMHQLSLSSSKEEKKKQFTVDTLMGDPMPRGRRFCQKAKPNPEKEMARAGGGGGGGNQGEGDTMIGGRGGD